MPNEFSKRLYKSMNDNNLTITKLSEKTNISKPLISNYLSGNYESKPENLFKLAEALNVNPLWLKGEDVPENAEYDSSIFSDKEYELYKNMSFNKLKMLIVKTGILDDDGNINEEKLDTLIKVLETMNSLNKNN